MYFDTITIKIKQYIDSDNNNSRKIPDSILILCTLGLADKTIFAKTMKL